MIRSFIKYAALTVIYVLAAFALILIFVGGENDDLIMVIGTKAIAIVMLYGVYHLTRWMKHMNLIPKPVIIFFEKLTEED